MRVGSVFPQRVGVWPIYMVRRPFLYKIIMSFYFYNIIYFTAKIYVYQLFEFCLVVNHFQKVLSIGY